MQRHHGAPHQSLEKYGITKPVTKSGFASGFRTISSCRQNLQSRRLQAAVARAILAQVRLPLFFDETCGIDIPHAGLGSLVPGRCRHRRGPQHSCNCVTGGLGFLDRRSVHGPGGCHGHGELWLKVPRDHAVYLSRHAHPWVLGGWGQERSHSSYIGQSPLNARSHRTWSSVGRLEAHCPWKARLTMTNIVSKPAAERLSEPMK